MKRATRTLVWAAAALAFPLTVLATQAPGEGAGRGKAPDGTTGQGMGAMAGGMGPMGMGGMHGKGMHGEGGGHHAQGEQHALRMQGKGPMHGDAGATMGCSGPPAAGGDRHQH